jgi:hypothetical protein
VVIAMALETEIATYRARLPDLKADEGKFVLIQGDQIGGTFRSWENAVKTGFEKFKFDPFLVKQIQVFERSLFVSNYVEPQLARSSVTPSPLPEGS